MPSTHTTKPISRAPDPTSRAANQPPLSTANTAKTLPRIFPHVARGLRHATTSEIAPPAMIDNTMIDTTSANDSTTPP